MKYYKCIVERFFAEDFVLKDKIYREDWKGYDEKNGGRESLSCYVEVYSSKLIEVTQLEYLKSINLKEKLIELAKSNKYAIKLNSKEEAIKLDKIFLAIDTPYYINKRHYTILQQWWHTHCDPVIFNYAVHNLSCNINKHTVITIKELLDYV